MTDTIIDRLEDRISDLTEEVSILEQKLEEKDSLLTDASNIFEAIIREAKDMIGSL